MLASPHPGERSCRRRPGFPEWVRAPGGVRRNSEINPQVCETNQGEPSMSICDAAIEDDEDKAVA